MAGPIDFPNDPMAAAATWTGAIGPARAPAAAAVERTVAAEGEPSRRRIRTDATPADLQRCVVVPVSMLAYMQEFHQARSQSDFEVVADLEYVHVEFGSFRDRVLQFEQLPLLGAPLARFGVLKVPTKKTSLHASCCYAEILAVCMHSVLHIFKNTYLNR